MQVARLILAIACTCGALGAAAQTPNPYASSANPAPPPSYTGPLFALSYNYPDSVPAATMPWRAAINNQTITTANAGAYAEALKAAIGDDMRVLLQDYKNWDAAKRGWYNEPWMAWNNPKYPNAGDMTREPIHGMYVGSGELDPPLFVKSGLKKPFTTYVLTYYDRTAATTLKKIWGDSAMQPVLTKESTQFAEGSIIVKAAFATAGADVWPVMKGALTWPLFITTNATVNPNQTPPRTVTNTSLLQFDIIVKDSVSAPKTGWVFTTLVYDSRIASNDIWKKMVVMGAQWGNDPQADNPAVPKPVLMENWLNPKAPAYASETLGWGERMSGPNDGAMNNIVYASGTKPQFNYITNGKNSSCMSCHSAAQWNVASHASPSFLLPALATTQFEATVKANHTDYVVSPAPGSPLWMKWFQNRQGDEPMDAGSIAADFDMVLTFKTLPAWYAATHPEDKHEMLHLDLHGKRLAPRVKAGASK